MQLKMRLRPSSHSDDYTLIYSFPTHEAAEKGAEAVGAKADGNRVIYHLWIECEKGEVVKDAQRIKLEIGATNCKVYHDYQNLEIVATLPKGASNDVQPLILTNEQVRIITLLKRLCPPPKTKNLETTTQLTFRYEGDEIYQRGEDGGCLGETPLKNTSIEVHVLET
jgi:hypothetical protein